MRPVHERVQQQVTGSGAVQVLLPWELRRKGVDSSSSSSELEERVGNARGGDLT